jgi:putative transposase
MVVKKSWHCAYEIHYHIVLPVKYRRALLLPEIEQDPATIATEIQERYEIEFEEMGADRDHIHLLCSALPKMSIGTIVRIFKSVTARELFKLHPRLKRELPRGGSFSQMLCTVCNLRELQGFDQRKVGADCCRGQRVVCEKSATGERADFNDANAEAYANGAVSR